MAEPTGDTVITPEMVRKERERTGLTQEEMAARLLVSKRTYEKWEQASASNRRQIKKLYFANMQAMPSNNR